MNWVSELTGLTTGALITVIMVVLIINIPNVIKLIKYLKPKKLQPAEIKIDRIKRKLVLKTMVRCLNLIIGVTPDGENNPGKIKFTPKQKWSWGLVLYKAFMGDCREYSTDLALSKKWDKMSPAQFAEICENEPKWIVDTVTQSCIKTLEEYPEVIPMSFKDLSIHNRAKVGAECVKLIIEHFNELRNLKEED